MRQPSGPNWKRWLHELEEPAPAARIDRPFRVVAEQERRLQTSAAGVGRRRIRVRCYDLKVPYLDIEGRPAVGAAHLFIPARAKPPMPLVVNLHYESGLEGMASYVAQGWAAMSAAQGLNLFCHSLTFNLALVQAGRAMPFVDGKRIALTGASAGGYITLMVASQAFPIAAIGPQVPIVNAAYESAYIEKSARAARCGRKDADGKDASATPVLCSVAGWVTEMGRPLGDPNRRPANWIANSPVGVWRLITCPAQMAFSTADVLVPMNQVGTGLAYPKPSSFPARFSFEMSDVLAATGARMTFLDALDGGKARVFRITIPDSLRPTWEPPAPGQPPSLHLVSPPSSRSARFSVAIFDEGPPDPRLGHYKYAIAYSNLAFFRHWLGKARPIRADQLTGEKLEMLMRRFLGEHFEGVTNYRPSRGSPAPMSRRNRPGRDQLDVILGLRAYCEAGKSHAARLARLYARLPVALRALDTRRGGFTARFQDDVEGGLTFHEASLHRRWGDRRAAAQLAVQLLRSRRHQDYAKCLPRMTAG